MEMAEGAPLDSLKGEPWINFDALNVLLER
jgi:hypothetical protein